MLAIPERVFYQVEQGEVKKSIKTFPAKVAAEIAFYSLDCGRSSFVCSIFNNKEVEKFGNFGVTFYRALVNSKLNTVKLTRLGEQSATNPS